ncbi:MAG: cytochrome P450 [Acidobacteria bacterium]|nr:MAG: cytochrome P450 [Acidobacteriota bacterium]
MKTYRPKGIKLSSQWRSFPALAEEDAVAQIKMTDLASPRFKANPYPFYARLRAEAPVCRTTLLRQRTWLVTRYADVLAVLKDERFVKDWPPKTRWLHRFAGPITRHMLNQDGADHMRLRTLVHKAFTRGLIEQLRARIQSVCDELLTQAAHNGRLELMHDYALPLPLTVIAELLGIPERDRFRFHTLSRSSLSASTLAGVVRSLPDQWALIRHLRKLIKERRTEPRADLITALIQAEEAGDRLSEAELLGMITLLLIAGYETTVNLIGNGALALIEHPQERARFEQHPALVESAIEELLRYTSPLDMASQRFAREDVNINGATIPRGDLVIAIVGSANHDETQFPEPETFDITREPNKHLAFGQGAHFCLGAPLARLEGQIALTTLFQRFPNLRLAQAPESLRWRKSLIVRGLEELPLAF